MKIAQFMACGVPIVATDVDEAKMISDIGCGTLVRSADGFAEELVRLALSKQLRAEMGSRGRQYAERVLDLPAVVESYKVLLSEVQLTK